MSGELNLSVVPTQPCDVDFTWYEDIRAHLLRRTVNHPGRLLDIGCRRGDVLTMLSRQISEGVGIDICQEDLDYAERARLQHQIANIRFERADATAIPFPSESFDFVLLLGDVLSYWNTFGKHEIVVSEIRRVLKPGGIAVHESMNWDWEYRWPYPQSDIWFQHSGISSFSMHRVNREISGLESFQNFEVRPGTPLYHWILEQDWPISPQGSDTKLEVREYTPIAQEWLLGQSESHSRHYRAQDLAELYRSAGFLHPEVFGYGQTYDIAAKAGLIDDLAVYQSKLAAAEAEVAFTLRLGSGPWLFLVAEK